MIIDFALPIDNDIMAGYRDYVKRAAVSVMDYAFHMAITKYNEQAQTSTVLIDIQRCLTENAASDYMGSSLFIFHVCSYQFDNRCTSCKPVRRPTLHGYLAAASSWLFSNITTGWVCSASSFTPSA